MEQVIPSKRGYTPKQAKRNKNLCLNPLHVRAALMRLGLSLAAWARMNGYANATQVSLALHGRRNTARAKQIRSALRQMLEGTR